ncbi:MAG: hypothetical protein H0X51_10160 [Parachlamydiaceae bacterium]|nr:hypothetical protein [Parachlamydiaceae bacterium]
MSKPFQIEIPKRGKSCAVAGEEFVAGHDYYSVLIAEEEGFQRKDFCLVCWNNLEKEKVIENVDSHWKSTVSAQKANNEPVAIKSRDERALELLKIALQNEALEDQVEAFVLALYLARRKLLHLRQEIQRDGQKVNLYEIVATEEMIAVKRVLVSQLQITAVQTRIAEKLRHHG